MEKTSKRNSELDNECYTAYDFFVTEENENKNKNGVYLGEKDVNFLNLESQNPTTTDVVLDNVSVTLLRKIIRNELKKILCKDGEKWEKFDENSKVVNVCESPCYSVSSTVTLP